MKQVEVNSDTVSSPQCIHNVCNAVRYGREVQGWIDYRSFRFIVIALKKNNEIAYAPPPHKKNTHTQQHSIISNHTKCNITLRAQCAHTHTTWMDPKNALSTIARYWKHMKKHWELALQLNRGSRFPSSSLSKSQILYRQSSPADHVTASLA